MFACPTFHWGFEGGGKGGEKGVFMYYVIPFSKFFPFRDIKLKCPCFDGEIPCLLALITLITQIVALSFSETQWHS